MQKSSEMTRWTHPTNEAFYVLHKSAMGLFDTVKLLARIVWIIFSTAYLQKLLSENAPFLGNASFAVAVAVLVFLHYFGNELLRYTAYNKLDNDPNTVNTRANYIILALVYVGLLGLDIKGTTAYFDESPKFEHLENLNEGEQKAAVANRQATYSGDLKVLTDSYELDIEKLRGDSASAVAKAKKSVAVYDAADQKKLNRNISTAKTEAHSIIGAKQAELAAEQRKLLAAKNTDIATITQKHTTKGTKITSDADGNKTGAEQKGWLISLLCLGITVFCTIQGVKLRIRAGQKPVSRFTINDATGSVTEKLFDAAEDIWQRAAHQAIDKVHSALTIKELDALDGAFSLKKKGQDAATNKPGNNNDLLGGGGGGGIKPPPMPPAPAQPLGGKSAHEFTGKRFDQYSGDDKMIIAEELSKFTGYTNRVCMSFLIGTNPFVGLEKGQSEYKVIFDIDNIIGHIKDYEKSVYGKDVTPTLMPSKLRIDPCHSLHSAHEAGHTTVYAAICSKKGNHFKGIKVYANDTQGEFLYAYSNTELTSEELAVIKMAGFAAESRYLSHKQLDYFNEIMSNHSTQPDIIEATEFVGIEKIQTAYLEAYSIMSNNVGFFRECYKALRVKGSLDMIELRKLNETYFNTPDDDKMNLYNIPVPPKSTEVENLADLCLNSPDADKLHAELQALNTPTNDNAPISTVAQSIPTVAQQNTEKGLSDINDTLERLRSEIMKNSQSHFTRGDAKNNSVAKRIFEACDKAYVALKKGGEVNLVILNKFKEAATDRLDLCAAYNINYDSADILFHIIEKRGGGQ